MERKNTILLTVIAVATLLVAVIGATFAYFTATVTDNRTSGDGQGSTNLTTGQISGSTVVANVNGAAGKFTATDIYPGHKEVAALSIAATGEAGSKTGVTINYNVTQNGLGDNVKVKIYKSTTEVATNTTGNYFVCEKKSESGTGDEMHFFEDCNKDETGLGTLMKEHTLSSTPGNITLATDTITTTTKDVPVTVYYYVVVEFENKNTTQNTVMNTTLNGQITVTASPAA